MRVHRATTCPSHTDTEFVTEVAGYPSVFAHGMLTMGLTGRMLTNYVGDGRLTRFKVRFLKQVWPGDSLDVESTVDGIREENGERFVDLSLSTKNQNGEVLVNLRVHV